MLDYEVGLSEKAPGWEDVVESLKHNAGPILFTTFALGSAGGVGANRKREQIRAASQAPQAEISKSERVAVVMEMYDLVAGARKDLADVWLKSALPVAADQHASCHSNR